MMTKKLIIFTLLFLAFTFDARNVFAQRDREELDSYLPQKSSSPTQDKSSLKEKLRAKAKEKNKEKDSEIKIIPIIDISVLGTFSQVIDSEEFFGIDANILFAPTVKFDDQNFLIPLYTATYSELRQIVGEEEGGLLVDRLSNHNLTLEFKHIASPEWTYRIKALGRVSLRKEEDIGWGDGLYDYWDLGGGGSVEYFFDNTNELKQSLTIGSEWYFRNYPNFISLASLASVTDIERHEKNYIGTKPTFRYMYKKPRFSVIFSYSPLYKLYVDKKTINIDGVLTDHKRKDWLHYGSIDTTWFPEESRFIYNLVLTTIINDSNQGYYDANGTPFDLTDDTFTPQYYDYWSLIVNPNIIYPIKLENGHNFIFKFGYAYMIRSYDDRQVQLADATYTNNDQLDESHTIKGQITYPLSDNFSVIGSANFTLAKSNQEFETFYRYTYRSFYATAGVRYSY
ncbi:hypothetical protein IID04_08325 [PVC group bacterium]|nr:hypothetical protein [PVC group bacterium]